jgi:hypothetical protein
MRVENMREEVRVISFGFKNPEEEGAEENEAGRLKEDLSENFGEVIGPPV